MVAWEECPLDRRHEPHSGSRELRVVTTMIAHFAFRGLANERQYPD